MPHFASHQPIQGIDNAQSIDLNHTAAGQSAEDSTSSEVSQLGQLATNSDEGTANTQIAELSVDQALLELFQILIAIDRRIKREERGRWKRRVNEGKVASSDGSELTQ